MGQLPLPLPPLCIADNEILEFRLLSEAWKKWDNELQLSKQRLLLPIQCQNSNEPLHVPVAVDLPVEIWGAIAAYLPKSALRTWLSLPGIWRAIARKHFFKTVILIFSGLSLPSFWLPAGDIYDALDTLDEKSSRGRRLRTIEILCHVARNPTFSQLIRKLVVHIDNISDLGTFTVVHV